MTFWKTGIILGRWESVSWRSLESCCLLQVLWQASDWILLGYFPLDKVFARQSCDLVINYFWMDWSADCLVELIFSRAFLLELESSSTFLSLLLDGLGKEAHPDHALFFGLSADFTCNSIPTLGSAFGKLLQSCFQCFLLNLVPAVLTGRGLLLLFRLKLVLVGDKLSKFSSLGLLLFLNFHWNVVLLSGHLYW